MIFNWDDWGNCNNTCGQSPVSGNIQLPQIHGYAGIVIL